jgi:hypothetical protein
MYIVFILQVIAIGGKTTILIGFEKDSLKKKKMYFLSPLNICDTCVCSSCYRKGHTIIVSSFNQLWSAK